MAVHDVRSVGGRVVRFRAGAGKGRRQQRGRAFSRPCLTTSRSGTRLRRFPRWCLLPCEHGSREANHCAAAHRAAASGRADHGPSGSRLAASPGRWPLASGKWLNESRFALRNIQTDSRFGPLERALVVEGLRGDLEWLGVLVGSPRSRAASSPDGLPGGPRLNACGAR